MKITCDVIRDLLPLYAEEMASADSKAIVEAHLKDCPECSQAVMKIKEPTVILPDGEENLKTIRSHIRRRIWLSVGCVVLALCCVASMVGCWLFNPIYLPMETILSVEEYDGFPGDDTWIDIWSSYEAMGNHWQRVEGRLWGTEGAQYLAYYTMRFMEMQYKDRDPADQYLSCRPANGPVYVFTGEEKEPMQLLFTQENWSVSEPKVPQRWYVLQYSVAGSICLGLLCSMSAIILRKRKAGKILGWAAAVFLIYGVTQICVCGFSLLSFFPKREFFWAAAITLTGWGAGLLGNGVRTHKV